jgi:hypothetical protein
MAEDVRISELDFTRLSEADGRSEYESRPDWVAPCPKCGGQVVFGRDSLGQARACSGCGGRYYRALCVEGQHYVLVSNDNLLEFASGVAVDCPHPECGFVLAAFSYPNPEVRYESLDVVTWKEDRRREEFRDRALQRIQAGSVVSPQSPRSRPPFFPVQTLTPPKPQDDRERFEEYHFTTGARLKQAEYYLLHIHREYGRFSAEKSALGEGLPEFVRHDLLLRGFVMNLRSALDVLCQELLLYYKIPVEEMAVDFGRRDARKKLPAAVAALITTFSNEWAYVYLNRLRNVLEHRRAPLPRKRVTTSVPVYAGGRVRPARPHPDVQLMADDPESPPGSETFELGRETCSVCHRLLSAVNDFVLSVYEAAQ